MEGTTYWLRVVRDDSLYLMTDVESNPNSFFKNSNVSEKVYKGPLDVEGMCNVLRSLKPEDRLMPLTGCNGYTGMLDSAYKGRIVEHKNKVLNGFQVDSELEIAAGVFGIDLSGKSEAATMELSEEDEMIIRSLQTV